MPSSRYSLTPNLPTKILAATGNVTEVLIIDSHLDGLAETLGKLRPGVEVWQLDGGASALDQVSSILAGYQGLSAIHLMSHGRSGEIHLGTEIISGDTLAEQGDMFGLWGRALKADGDFLLYGCDIASGEAGSAFVTAFAAATDYQAGHLSADVVFAWFQAHNSSLAKMDNTTYVQTLYQNTYGRQANTTELNGHLAELQNNTLDRNGLAVKLAASSEAITAIGTVMQFDGWV